MTCPSAFSLVRSILDGSASYHFPNGDIFKRMTEKGIPWMLYHGDDLAMAYVLDGVKFGAGKPFDPRDPAQFSQFCQGLNSSSLPNYIFIKPNWGNLFLETYKGGNSQHPLGDVTSGEVLLKYLRGDTRFGLLDRERVDRYVRRARRLFRSCGAPRRSAVAVGCPAQRPVQLQPTGRAGASGGYLALDSQEPRGSHGL
jgi:hypothetical protein